MYKETKYSIKLNKGYLDPISSNLGLKQGCPLSPLLFNLYIDDMNGIFGKPCDPINLQGTDLSHFLYADDLVLVSETEGGLQNALDRLHRFSVEKRLSISIKKSKTMIFNRGGRLIKKYFKINGKPLEPVHDFCYLGFDVKASGTTKHAMNTLLDKANKAMRPLMGSIARFNLPPETSIKLFHSYIAPIALYNAENWAILTDKKLQNFSAESIFCETLDNKTDTLHRNFLKYILGVSKSCPNLAIYGETGELPLSLKAFRMLINFWYRIYNQSEETLAKKALLENIALRTNWIKTVEKILGSFEMTDVTQTPMAFKTKANLSMQSKYTEFWYKNLNEDTSSRLVFYKKIKNEFKLEDYLNIPSFENRKAIAKIRCSDHPLEIERGRHKKIPRENRICKICPLNEVESEDHFLSKCTFYIRYKPKHNLSFNTNSITLLKDTEPTQLGRYFTEALSERKKYKEWFDLD